MTKSEWERMLQYFEDDEEVTEEDICDYERNLAEEMEWQREELEERSMMNAWQDDMMFLWRFER